MQAIVNAVLRLICFLLIILATCLLVIRTESLPRDFRD